MALNYGGWRVNESPSVAGYNNNRFWPGRQAGAWSMDRWMAIEMQIEFHGGSDWGAIIQ